MNTLKSEIQRNLHLLVPGTVPVRVPAKPVRKLTPEQRERHDQVIRAARGRVIRTFR